eukprot:3297786-Rhodomonas_salina.1
MVRSETAYNVAQWCNGVQKPFALLASMSGKRAHFHADGARAPCPVVLRRNNATSFSQQPSQDMSAP